VFTSTMMPNLYVILSNAISDTLGVVILHNDAYFH